MATTTATGNVRGLWAGYAHPKTATASRRAFAVRPAVGDWCRLEEVEPGETVVAWLDTRMGRVRPVHELGGVQRERAAAGAELLRRETLQVQVVARGGVR